MEAVSLIAMVKERYGVTLSDTELLKAKDIEDLYNIIQRKKDDVSFRNVEEKDLEMIRNWRNSQDVRRFMYTEDFITEEQQIRWFNKISREEQSRYWVISYKEKPLGLVSITEISKTFDSCFWAFYLGDTNVRGAGIGSKIEYNILSYVFDELGLNKLRCEVLTTNPKVITMHEKFGFRREAFYRDHVRKGDEYFDVVGLAMLNREWQEVKEYHYNRIYNR